MLDCVYAKMKHSISHDLTLRNRKWKYKKEGANNKYNYKTLTTI